MPPLLEIHNTLGHWNNSSYCLQKNVLWLQGLLRRVPIGQSFVVLLKKFVRHPVGTNDHLRMVNMVVDDRERLSIDAFGPAAVESALDRIEFDGITASRLDDVRSVGRPISLVY